MTKINYKHWQIVLTVLSFFILLCSFYFQYIEGLHPCPLCLMQRFSVLLLFLIGLIAITVHRLKTRKILVFLQALFAALGLYFASRQLWLQLFPASNASSCMPELDVLIHYFPLQDILRSLLWGTGDCAEVNWRWLGLTMPAWAALYFFGMLIVTIPLYGLLRKQ